MNTNTPHHPRTLEIQTGKLETVYFGSAVAGRTPGRLESDTWMEVNGLIQGLGQLTGMSVVIVDQKWITRYGNRTLQLTYKLQANQ